MPGTQHVFSSACQAYLRVGWSWPDVLLGSHTTSLSPCSKGLLNSDALGPSWIQTHLSPGDIHNHPSQPSSVRALEILVFLTGELATN